MFNCPFCPGRHSAGLHNCPSHPLYQVPRDFVSLTRDHPALSLMTLGYSGVGKSWFVSAMSLVLDNAFIDEVSYQPIDAYSFEQIRALRESIQREGRGLPPTKIDDPQRPLLLKVEGLVETSARAVAIYDVPGELFENFDASNVLNPAIRRVTTAWMMVDLEDFLGGSNSRRLHDLFLTYRTTLETHEVDFQNWNLIVVFTKADRYQTMLPEDVVQYVLEDELGVHLFQGGVGEVRKVHYLDRVAYLKRMEKISEVLRDFTIQKVNGGRQFERMVQSSGMSLAFTAVSASGQESEDGSIGGEDLKPLRILDPLLWAFYREANIKERPLAFLVDDSQESSEIQSEQVMGSLWERMNQNHEVSVYYLGSSKSVANPAQKPTAGLGSRSRLIGPSLEGLMAGSKAVVLAAGPILDLRDFASTHWRNRLLVVKSNTDFSVDWPHQIVFESGNGPDLIAQMLRGFADE